VRRDLTLGAWLVVVWMVLWRDLSWANLLSGIAVAVAAIVLFPRARPLRPGSIRPLAAARFVIGFLWGLAVANAVVAWEVLTPRNRDNEGIIEIPVIDGYSDTLLALLTVVIGLTPGTVVVDHDEAAGRLYVHVLHLNDRERVRRDLVELEARLLDAFGGRERVGDAAGGAGS